MPTVAVRAILALDGIGPASRKRGQGEHEDERREDGVRRPRHDDDLEPCGGSMTMSLTTVIAANSTSATTAKAHEQRRCFLHHYRVMRCCQMRRAEASDRPQAKSNTRHGASSIPPIPSQIRRVRWRGHGFRSSLPNHRRLSLLRAG